MTNDLNPEVRAILDGYMSRKVMAALDAGQGVVIYPETLNSLLKPLTEAASLIQRLEGERDKKEAGWAECFRIAIGWQDRAEAAEQALSASQQEVEAWREAFSALWWREVGQPFVDRLCQPSREGSKEWFRRRNAALQTGGKEHG